MSENKQNPNSLANLQPPYSTTNQPKNKNGRKPSKLKKYIKDNNLNYNDISAMAKYVLPMSRSQITEFIKDPSVPVIMQLFAKGVLADMKNGNYRNLMLLLDRAVGKPKEIVEINSKNENYNQNIEYSNLTEDDAKKEFFRKISEAQGGLNLESLMD